jgi:hypothetical protein
VDTPQTVVATFTVINTTRKAVFPLVVGADLCSSSVQFIGYQDRLARVVSPRHALGRLVDQGRRCAGSGRYDYLLNMTRVSGEQLTKSVNYHLCYGDRGGDHCQGATHLITRLTIPFSTGKKGFCCRMWRFRVFHVTCGSCGSCCSCQLETCGTVRSRAEKLAR